MPRWIVPLLTLALGAFSSTGARAEFRGWSYTATAVVPTLKPDDGDSSVTLNVPTGSSTRTTDDVATAYLTTSSGASPGSPHVFTNRDFSVALMLTDAASGMSSEPLLFEGVLNGTLSTSTASLELTPTSTTRYTVVLGTNEYTVTLGALIRPSAPTAVFPGLVGVHVAVSPEAEPTALEPTGLAFLGMSLTMLAVGYISFRRSIVGTTLPTPNPPS
jgi:hypothetical protein